MKIKKLPAELYVVSANAPEQEWLPDASGNWVAQPLIDHNFGFLHVHEPTKAGDAKKKETQEHWAYGYNRKVEERDDGWYAYGFDYKWEPTLVGPIKVPFERKLDPKYAPRIWQNVPLTGFKIIDTVNRYRGNKLMKVLDPRGVEFEITIKSLFQIISNGTIKNGEILDACVWKTNKDLVIVNTFGDGV